jgi:hypothetical protein
MSTRSSITEMRLLGRAVRLLFSREDPERAHALARELARTTAAQDSTEDPVRNWEQQWQVDRGLGRARRLQRMVHSPAWRSHEDADGGRRHSPGHAADFLFAAVMNLAHQMPLSDESHIFRLWYLAARATCPPENAKRLFGDLQSLPEHQQLAAGARLLAAITTGQSSGGASQPRLSPQRPLTNHTVGESG